MTRVRELLGQHRSVESEVARRWDSAARTSRATSWGDFQRDVTNLRGLLSQEKAGAWVLLTEDAYAFAVGLFALWHSGSHAILPPNGQPKTLEALESRSAGIISDLPELFPAGASIHPLEVGEVGVAPELGSLRSDALAVELFTSGTTGDEKPVIKRICHLEEELFELEGSWGKAVEGSTFVSTASHQHLYGLLFGVLWPLCFGRPFESGHPLHAGELIPRMCDSKSCVLASVPTSLKRMVQHTGASALAEHCAVVFSSGGPLPAETAHAVAEILGHAPIEVLGSTETGGIAWRVQEPGAGEATWMPFASVRVTRDEDEGVLRVASPFVSVESNRAGYATGDLIELLPNNRFRLEGRADQFVKVGEKRLDLARMTSTLCSHEWLEEAALTTIEREGDARIAAVVVASDLGLEALKRDGRHVFTRGLRAILGSSWDPVLHPRYWRIEAELPENAQGKVTREAIRSLFQTHSVEASCSDRPEVLEEHRGSDFIERICLVPSDLSCFAGHFPERPVVPGVLQLDWAMELLALLQEAPPVVEEIEMLKFTAPLEPGTRFRLYVCATELSNDSQAAISKMEFSLWDGEERLSVGRVRLAPSHGENTDAGTGMST